MKKIKDTKQKYIKASICFQDGFVTGFNNNLNTAQDYTRIIKPDQPSGKRYASLLECCDCG